MTDIITFTKTEPKVLKPKAPCFMQSKTRPDFVVLAVSFDNDGHKFTGIVVSACDILSVESGECSPYFAVANFERIPGKATIILD